MINACRIICYLLAFLGFIVLLGAIGTSDFYIIELEQTDPEYVWTWVKVGVTMMIPMAVSVCLDLWKEGKQDNVD